jgi:hypothetical protein
VVLSLSQEPYALQDHTASAITLISDIKSERKKKQKQNKTKPHLSRSYGTCSVVEVQSFQQTHESERALLNASALMSRFEVGMRR